MILSLVLTFIQAFALPSVLAQENSTDINLKCANESIALYIIDGSLSSSRTELVGRYLLEVRSAPKVTVLGIVESIQSPSGDFQIQAQTHDKLFEMSLTLEEALWNTSINTGSESIRCQVL